MFAFTIGMVDLFGSVDYLGGAMTFHRSRHVVLSGNVANVDTPGFRPFDLERMGPMAGSGESLPLRVTGGAHLALSGGQSTRLTQSFDDSSASASADKNTVNLERELAKVDANKVRYATTSELVSRKLALLRYAAADGLL